jgi:serine phosphatase RsbU (regulator of sigma subunit)
MFAPVGIAMDIMMLRERDWLVLALLVITSGGVAVLYARAGFTGRYWLYVPAGVIAQSLLILLTRSLQADGPRPESLDAPSLALVRERIQIDVTLLITFIGAGYGLFVSVFSKEGARYFATSTEIRLARRIHDRLVPAIAGRNRDVEWAGVSRPSGDIGGDLVDVVEGPGGLVGRVADVSGHGVGAGLLMGMFKTAFRTSVTRVSDPAELLAEIHTALSPLTEPNMFATAAVMRVAGGTLRFAGAGHPPLLLYRQATGRVEEAASSGPAIALLDDFSCSAADLPFARGDVALLITDGILEALDASQREVGVDAVSRLLVSHAAVPLDDLLARVAALASEGTRVDDQTVLIVRAL